MHWVQRHILKQLAFADSMRYRDLKPESIDGNLFQYHAKNLQDQGLISRNTDGYQLTATGKAYVANLSQAKLMNARKLPRAVVMIIAKNNNDEYLLFRWARQPYRGQVSLPFGRRLYGQTSTESAADQLVFKTGHKAKLQFIGLADSIYQKDNVILDHLSITVFEAKNLVKENDPDGLTGEYFWGNPKDFSASETTPGFAQIVDWYNDKDRPPLLEITETY